MKTPRKLPQPDKQGSSANPNLHHVPSTSNLHTTGWESQVK
jgi:hypothetical protein